MKSIVVVRHGGPEVLRMRDSPAPAVAPGTLLVRVAAAGVNYMDTYGREGNPRYAGPLPYTPGAEGAGTVLAVGDGVHDYAPGQTVAWAAAPGSYAEELLVPESAAVPVPDGVDARVAAAVMLQGMTAHYLCHSTYPVAPGDTVVVHAGAGGVGLLLTQMVKMRGGTVIATASTEEKRAIAARAGADRVCGYDGLLGVVGEVSGGAAVVYDGVGASTFDASLECLRSRGYLVLYGAASGPVPPFDLMRLSGPGSLFVTRPTLAAYIASRQELRWRSGDLFDWIGSGRLTVAIGATYPLDRAADAHRDLQGRATSGKLLLLPGGDGRS